MAKYPNFGYRGMPIIPIPWVAVMVTLMVGEQSVGIGMLLGIIFIIILFTTDDKDTTNKVSILIGAIASLIALIAELRNK